MRVGRGHTGGARQHPLSPVRRDRAQLLSEIPGVIATIFETEVAYDEASLAKVAGQEDIANRLAALINGLASSTGWDELEIKAAITAAAEGIGVKMGALMLPCRVGVMGSTSGADLVPVLVLLGQAEVVRRLKNFATKLN